MTMLPRSRDVRISMPVAEMRRLCERARHEWGERAEEMTTPRHAWIRIWLGGHDRLTTRGGARPVGEFSVRWHVPTESQATIDKLAWDPSQGGSEDEVREVINALAGWPVARAAPSPLTA